MNKKEVADDSLTFASQMHALFGIKWKFSMHKSSVPSDREQGGTDEIKKLPFNSLTDIFCWIAIKLKCGRKQASLSHLPITRMQNRDQYRMSIRGVSGLALEESKRHTFSRI